MAQEIGVAYVTLLPSARGFGKAVEGELDGAAKGHEKAQKSLWGNVAKYGALAATAIGAVFTGKILSGGLSRALNIEDAQAKLKGLGHDTQTVTGIMENALAAVKGTAFGLDQAATIAASAVAAGIKPGQQLERYLKLTADAATIAGSSLSEMGSILNKVQGSGKAYNDSLQQLADRGIPIYQWLADEIGATTDEVFKLASQGKISSEQFQAAIEKNIAGAALASGETTRGAFANMQAAMSRWGAALLSGVLPFAKSFFSEMIVIFDGLNERSKPFVDRFNEWLTGIDIQGAGQRFLDWLDNLDFSGFADTFAALKPALDVAREIGPVLFQLLGPALVALRDALAPALPQIAGALADAVVELAPSLVELLEAVIPLIPELVQLAVNVLPVLLDALRAAVPLVQSLVGEFTGVFEALNLIVGFLSGDSDYSKFTESIRGIGGVFGDTAERASRFGEQLAMSLGALLSFANRLFGTLADGTRGAIGFIRDAWDGVGKSIGDALKLVFGLVTGNNELVAESFGSLRDRIGGIWQSTLTTIANGLLGTRDKVESTVTSFVSSVSRIPEQIGKALEGLPGRFLTLGRQIVDGLIEGIQSKVRQAVLAIHNLGSNMVQAMKDWLGIRSPSRVFRDEIGKQIAAGVIAGIDGMQVQTEAAVRSLVEVPQVSVPQGAQSSKTVNLNGVDPWTVLQLMKNELGGLLAVRG